MMTLIIDSSGESGRETTEEKQREEKTHNSQIQKERKRTFEQYAKHLIHISLYDIYSIRLVYIYKHFFAYLVLFFLQIISGIWRILSAKLGGQN